VGHLSLLRSFSHHASVSFMVVRFQVVLPLPRVPSVYVFVRTCVRARAAADADVGLSKSCFHVPLCSTLLLLGRCRASTYSSSAPSGFFSATCVCPSHIDGGRLVSAHTHRLHPHHQHVAHTQPFVDVISIQVLAGGPPATGRKPSSRFVTSHPALYCPDLVCVCVCVLCMCVYA
jgi:hypothetical protein